MIKNKKYDGVSAFCCVNSLRNFFPLKKKGLLIAPNLAPYWDRLINLSDNSVICVFETFKK